MLNTLIRHRGPTEEELADFIEEARQNYISNLFASQEAMDKFDDDYEVQQGVKVKEARYNCLASQQELSLNAYAESIINFANRIFYDYEKPKLNYDQLVREVNERY